MRIALDVESVLADTNTPALQSTDQLDPDELLGNWDMSDEQFQVYIGVTDAIWRHKPEMIPPEEPSLAEYVDEMNERATVDIVTGRQHVDENIMWWLDQHDIQYDSFISTGEDKWLFEEYDLFIDDNPEMFGECRLLLRNQPWNSHLKDEDSKMVDRIYSVGEVIEYL